MGKEFHAIDAPLTMTQELRVMQPEPMQQCLIAASGSVTARRGMRKHCGIRSDIFSHLRPFCY
jgi:hypothetical protein